METKQELKLADYERWVHEIWVDTEGRSEAEQLRALFIATVGLSEEVGELIGPLKKHVRSRRPVSALPEVMDRHYMMNEVGDVLYYLTRVANHLGFTLQDAMQANVDKLVARYNAHPPGVPTR